MILYSFKHSTNPLKVRMAFAEMNLKYEIKEITLFRGEHRRPEFLQVNLLGKVPVLDDNGFILTESNAILTYLGRQYGSDLWPRDSQGEGKAMQWLFFESSQLANPLGHIWFNTFGNPKVGRRVYSQSEMSAVYEDAEYTLTFLDAHLSTHNFLLGNSFSLVDCAIGVQIASLRDTPLGSLTKWPNLFSYSQRIVSRPSWKKAGGEGIFD